MRRWIAISLALLIFLAGCQKPESPANGGEIPNQTQPSVNQQTNQTDPIPETTLPEENYRFYRLCDVESDMGSMEEALAELGIREDAWLVLYDDGTGVMAFRDTPDRIIYDEEKLWDTLQVCDYAVDDSGVISFSRDFGYSTLYFAPCDETPPQVRIDSEYCPEHIVDNMAGCWDGTVYETFPEDGAIIPRGTAVSVQIEFDEEGRCIPVISFGMERGDLTQTVAQYNENLDGLLLCGSVLGQPYLADSHIYVLNGIAYLYLRIGDPTAAENYIISAELFRPGEEPEVTDMYEDYYTSGWNPPGEKDLAGSWVLEATTPDGQDGQFFLQLWEDGRARFEWVYSDSASTQEVYDGSWSLLTEDRTYLVLDVASQDKVICDQYAVLMPASGNALFMTVGTEPGSLPVTPWVDELLGIWEHSYG